MSLNLSQRLVAELQSLNCKPENGNSDESLLSAIIQTLVSIDATHTEVMVPSLMADDDEATDVLDCAKQVQRLLMDRHISKTATVIANHDKNNNFIGVNGYRKETTNDWCGHDCGQALAATIARQVVALKKSLKAFRQMLNELKAKYNESVEQLTELHSNGSKD